MPGAFDIYPMIGAGIALLVLFLLQWLLERPEGETASAPAVIIAGLIALSPLLGAFWVERTAGTKIFSDFRDFSTAVAWFPLTILTMLVTDNNACIMSVAVCGFLVDPLLFGSRRSAYPGTIRIMMAYSRGMCGIIGTILALTFVAKLFDIGKPKNKKNVWQEVLSVVIWGYIGKKFFDFIGVTKPLALGSLFPGTRRP